MVCFLNEEASEDEDDDDVLNGDVEADEFGVVNGYDVPLITYNITRVCGSLFAKMP